ncbi:MAG: hypothetical protein ACTSR3_05775 [Candidatus Helarchaeota archaeon]
MVWYNLQIGNFQAKYTKLEKKREKFVDCDENGNILNKEFIPSKTIYRNKSGNEVLRGEVYKLIDGKARRKLKKTKFIPFEEKNFVSIQELPNLIIEQYYLVDCIGLRQEIVKRKKLYKAVFTSGNGFKLYECYFVPFKKYLLMVLGWGRITEQIKELLGDYVSLTEKERAYEDEVERVSEEELLKIYANGN